MDRLRATARCRSVSGCLAKASAQALTPCSDWQTRSHSCPASRQSRTRSSQLQSVHPPISRSSGRNLPRTPQGFSATEPRCMEAGNELVAGVLRWATMTRRSSFESAEKGTAFRRIATSSSSSGSAWWLSTLVPPSPGKCFRQPRTPVLSRPCKKAPAALATLAGSLLAARFPIPVPSIPVHKSATGAKSTLNPSRPSPVPQRRPQASHAPPPPRSQTARKLGVPPTHGFNRETAPPS